MSLIGHEGGRTMEQMGVMDWQVLVAQPPAGLLDCGMT